MKILIHFTQFFVLPYFYKCIQIITEEVILKCTDRNSVRLNLYAVFVHQIRSAKPAYCVLAGVQSEYSSIFVVILWWTETRLCGTGCSNWPESVVLVEGYSDRPQWSENIVLECLVLN